MTRTHLIFKERIRRLLPRHIRGHRIMFGRLKGSRIVTSWHDYPGAILGRTEKPLLTWFHHNVKAADTWIDVGAHYGYTAIALARLVGPAGRVFAFEPVLTTASCVARTRELNMLSQLTIVPFGLDSSPEVTTQQLPTTRGMVDSTIAPNRRGERVFLSSFDLLWPSLCGDHPAVHGVKIDVQGMELAVLRGMRRSLRRCKPTVVLELHTGVDRSAVIEALDACGYQRRGEPIQPDEDRTQPQYRDNCSYVFHPRR